MGHLEQGSHTTLLKLLLAVITAGALILLLAACGDEPAAEPTATPEPASIATPEPDVAFAPKLLFSVRLSEDNTVDSVAFYPDGDLVATGTFLKALVFDVPDGKQVLETAELQHGVTDLQISPDGRMMIAGLGVGGAILIDAETGEEIRQFHGGFDNYAAIDPDGQQVASGNRDGELWIWDAGTGEKVAEAASPDDEWLTAVAWSPDGSLVAAGYWDGNVVIFDAENMEIRHRLENPDPFGYATRIAWSPDGRLLAVGGAMEEFQDVVRIWNTSDGTVQDTLIRPTTSRGVAFSPDGNLLAIGEGDQISLWHVGDMRLYAELTWEVPDGESDWITDLDFSPDSTMLVASRWNGHLDLWLVQADV